MNTQHEQDYLNWYQRINSPGTPFDPTELVRLAREQWARPALAEAFARCTCAWPKSELYTHFIAPARMRAQWKFAATLPLAHPTWGTLLVDVVHDATVPGGYAIGGIEYLDRVLGHHVPVEHLEPRPQPRPGVLRIVK